MKPATARATSGDRGGPRFSPDLPLPAGRVPRYSAGMDFDQLLLRFFGTEDIGTLSPQQLLDGLERVRLQFGLEKDGGRRFALWSLMYMLGVAPDVDESFDDPDDRAAAREFMDMTDQEMAEDDDADDDRS